MSANVVERISSLFADWRVSANKRVMEREYKYYNMDQVVAQALSTFERIQDRHVPSGAIDIAVERKAISPTPARDVVEANGNHR